MKVKEFIEKYTFKKVHSESSYEKLIPKIKNEQLTKIRNSFFGKFFAVYSDETQDPMRDIY